MEVMAYFLTTLDLLSPAQKNAIGDRSSCPSVHLHQTVSWTAEFDWKTALGSLGRDGSTQGEPLSNPQPSTAMSSGHWKSPMTWYLVHVSVT